MAKRVSSIYGNALFELAAEENKMDALFIRGADIAADSS